MVQKKKPSYAKGFGGRSPPTPTATEDEDLLRQSYRGQ